MNTRRAADNEIMRRQNHSIRELMCKFLPKADRRHDARINFGEFDIRGPVKLHTAKRSVDCLRTATTTKEHG
jgi:hypothetical protein